MNSWYYCALKLVFLQENPFSINKIEPDLVDSYENINPQT